MEEERFRISVCLQCYYDDQRSRAYISVIPKNKVQWLQQRLRSLFALEGLFFLRSRGHLLHPDEPLSLLRPDDPVEVVPLPEELLEHGKHKTKLNGMDCSQSQDSSQSLYFEHTSKKVPSKVVPSKELPSNEVPSKDVSTKEVPGKEVPSKEIPMSQEDARDGKLLQMKQQALQLLDQFSDVNQDYVNDEDWFRSGFSEVPKRRRRVRRRRRRSFNEESSNNGDLLAPVAIQTTEDTVSNGETQNGSIVPRKPRLVHSLSPS